MRLSNVKPEMPDQAEVFGLPVPTDCHVADEHGNEIKNLLRVRFAIDTAQDVVAFELDYVPEAWLKLPAAGYPAPDGAAGESQGLYYKTERYRVTEPFILRGFRV